MNTIKKEKMRIFSLILVESTILLFMSLATAHLLYCLLGNPFKSYHVLITLFCGFPIGAFILLREKKLWLKKIPEAAFSIILAELTGFLLYTLIIMTGIDKFWFYCKFALAVFIVTAGLGYYFSRRVSKWKQELYTFGILALASGFELIVIFINSKLNGIIVSAGISLSLAVFNMVDFAKMSENLDGILNKKQHRSVPLVTATKLYLNFIGLLYLQDATRLFFRFFYDLTTDKKLTNKN